MVISIENLSNSEWLGMLGTGTFFFGNKSEGQESHWVFANSHGAEHQKFNPCVNDMTH
jgi:hypothetical protein